MGYVVSICDDITVYGANEEGEQGVVFSISKCHVKQYEITFFGNTYSKARVSPVPKKVGAIGTASRTQSS